MSYKVGSLFAGVGGICLGFKRASELFELKFANEMDEAACETYSTNFNHDLIKGDIQKILNPNILIEEKEFLILRLNELSYMENHSFGFDEKLIKKCIKNLNNQFFVNILMKESFDLTDNIKKEIAKLGYNEEIFKKFIEFKLVVLNLENYTDEKIKMFYDNYKEKNQQLTGERIDILTAGFPCQAFSIAGDRKGFSDHRGELFYSVVNLVNQLEKNGHGKPRVLFLENVKNLVSHDEGNTFKVIKSELENLGYTLKYKVLNTYKYTNLPQNRERIFIVCFLNKEDANSFGSFNDIKELNRTKEQLKNALESTLDYNISKETNLELYYTREKYPQYFMTEKEYLESGKTEWINLDKDINEMFEIYQVRRGMYVRKNQSGVCPTLTANMGTGGHNVPLIKTYDGIRKLSPKDCFNLQGFRVGENYILPKSISSAALYKQAGNAVSVDVIELIAKKILKAFIEVDGNILTSKSVSNKSPNLNYRYKYFKVKKYSYFTKYILRNEYFLKSTLKNTLVEINNLLIKKLNDKISQKELEKIKKHIIIELNKI